MSGKIAGSRNEDVPAFVGVAPDSELPDSRLQHLIGMKARIFAQRRTRERGDQRLRRMAELEMPRNETCREIGLSVPVEGIEQGDADCLNIGGQIVELLAVLARNSRRRHIEIASEIESHRSMQDGAHGRDVAIGLSSPDPLEHLVDRIGIGEDVVRRLPVGVLIGIAEARHPERRPVSQRSTKVTRGGACPDRCLESINDPDWIVTEQLSGERRGIRAATCIAADSKQFGQLAGCLSHSATRSTGWRQAVNSSAPRAATIWPTTVGSRTAACSQPIKSRHSNALLMKSSECPESANTRSVSAATKASASTSDGSLAAIAVSNVRSAASR